MTKQRRLGVALAVVAGLWAAGACDSTLQTGRVGNTSNPPNPDGTCAAGLSVCGKGAFAQCLDLQSDHDHCGACDNACLMGIACAAGACQQVACTGSVTVTTQQLPMTLGAAGPGSYGIRLADVNCDRRPDLVSWDPTRVLQVSLGEAGGGFGAATTYEAAWTAGVLEVADWNSDGCDDLFLDNGLQSSCVEVWMGHPDGKLTPKTFIVDAGCQPPMMMVDLNGDGVLDMVSISPHNSDPPGVYLADANGAFHVAIPLAVEHNNLPSLVRDWNGDGFPDLVTESWGLSVYLNKGNGTFEGEMDCGVRLSGATVIEDLDHDGHIDVVTNTTDGRVGVLMGLGGCQFQPAVEYPVSGRIANLVYADLDGDRTGDLAIQTYDGGVYLLHGRGDGTFQVAQISSGSACTSCWLLVGDVTGDGKVDLVVAGVDTREGTNGPQLVPLPVQIMENTCP